MRNRIPPPVLTLLAGVLMVWLDRHHPVLDLLSGWGRWLGIFLVVAAIALTLTAMLQFKRASTTVNPLQPERASRLVTDGIFAYSRNPMYLAMLLLLLAGVALRLGSLTPWLVLPVLAAALTWLQILPEERALEHNFGDTYLAYRRRTGRWLGRTAGTL